MKATLRFTERELEGLLTWLARKQAIGALCADFNRGEPAGTMAAVRRVHRKLRAWKREESPDA